MARPNLRAVPDLAADIRAGRTGAREAVADTLAQIEARDGQLNAVVALDAEAALAAADAVDAAVAAGRPGDLPPYAGVPTLVKDLNNARGLPTTFGARSMQDFRPPFDDHTVARMRAAGFVIVGKTNVPEVGSLPFTESVLHGAARNPWSPDHTPGGSSGGAAAAVAAGYVAVAHGSDGGGSVRIPASNCGVVGLKPSRGRVSHAPLFGEQILGFSTQGTIGRRVIDAAALLDVMQGYATGDPYHLPPPIRPYVEEVRRPVGQLRIGLLQDLPWAPLMQEVATALKVAAELLQSLGHDVTDLDADLPRTVTDDFLRVWSAAVAANPLPYDQLEPHNRAFVDAGRDVTAPALIRTVTSLQATSRAFVGRCETVDVVLAPVLTRPPLAIGELAGLPQAELLDELARYLGITPVVNITGQPAISVPVHRSGKGLPIGVQLIGHPAGEAELIRLAAQVEGALNWQAQQP